MIQGSVDDVSTDKVIGWVYSSSINNPLKVQAIIDQRVIGEALADVFRPDLARASLGSGNCGFEIRFENSIDPSYLPFVETRLVGSTLLIPRTNIAGFSDYLLDVYRRYPFVGRYPSILGGLWTDRSDATALLKARADLGIVKSRDSSILSRFINDGLIVVDADLEPETALGESGTSKLAKSKTGRHSRKTQAEGSDQTGVHDVMPIIERTFFHGTTLRLLAAILDDNPIAVRAETIRGTEQSYVQSSALDELPSPAECVTLLLAQADGVSVEVIRGSHRFPEFSGDGISRWVPEGRDRVAAMEQLANVYNDAFRVSPTQFAIIGPGLIHRVHHSGPSSAVRLLVLPSRQGSVRFQQRAPEEESLHPSGARIWFSQLS